MTNQPNPMASRTQPVRGGQDALGDRPAQRMSLERTFPGTREPDEAPETLSDPHSAPEACHGA